MWRRVPAPKPASFALGILFACSLASAITSAGPFVVGNNSHVVVMEYEAWFGPNAVTFQGTAAMPLLQSADMQPLGGGYDSADPHVIRQHVAWMELMGIDAAISDLTNNVSCIFDTPWFAQKYLPYCTSGFRSSMQTIRDNTGNLYPAWTKLGTNLKLIPLLGGADETELYKDLDGKTAFEKEVDYFGALMQQYPDRQVIYEGKPLMLIFLGAAQDPSRGDNPLWLQIRKFLTSHPEIGEKYTFRMMAGYLDSQPYLWLNPGKADGPEEINPGYDFWSWVDRLKTSCAQPYCPYYPTFNKISSDGSRVENMTASIATAGAYGWGCPNENALPYCPDDALRFGANGTNGTYETFSSFMTYASELEPIFLMVHQFNEFVPPDEGFDANTDDDIEPANLWGFGALDAVQEQIAIYRDQEK
jgi:hypothetical protein